MNNSQSLDAIAERRCGFYRERATRATDMKGKELLEKLTDLLERFPNLKEAEVVCPIVDDQYRKKLKSQLGRKTGLPYEKLYSITEGSGDKGEFLILWPENELTHEPVKDSPQSP